MDSLLLKWHMNKYGDTDRSLADILGIHPHTLYMKMKGKKQQFVQSEIQLIAKRYDLNAEEITKIFFSETI